MTSERPASAFAIGAFYFCFFATQGIYVPFMPAYLKSLSLSTTEVGTLLAVTPLVTLFGPSFWGHLVDRFRSAGAVLSTIALGALICFTPMLVVERFAALAAALTAYAFFATSVAPVIDSIALQRVALVGGNYARMRMIGSIGFALSSASFGLLVGRVDSSAVKVPLLFIAAYFLWSLVLRPRNAAITVRDPFAGLGLLADRDLVRVLLACCLHWIAFAPFHVTLAIHIDELGLPPSVVGLSTGIGVLTEIAVMFAAPWFGARFPARRLLALAFAASIVRWSAMAWVSGAIAIELLSILHGLTFAAFWLGAVGYVVARVPPSHRGSGLALLTTSIAGVGGLVGFLSAGAAYEALGGHRLFGLAAVVEVLAMALLAGTRAPSANAGSPSATA
jgi:PPP family 3-phenylpropionic acid transporter